MGAVRKLALSGTKSKSSGSSWGISRPGRFDARKKFGVGVAEKVDGLHGVADHKAGAARALGPGGDEAGEQLVLAAAGVLELIDQQMADAVGDGQRGVGGQAVVALEHVLGDLRDLDEVHGSGLGKDDLQLGCGLAQQREAGLHDLPVLFGVARGRQSADGGEGAFEAGNGGERGNQGEEAALFALAVGREAESLIDLLAECAIAGEQQCGQMRRWAWRASSKSALPVNGAEGNSASSASSW